MITTDFIMKTTTGVSQLFVFLFKSIPLFFDNLCEPPCMYNGNGMKEIIRQIDEYKKHNLLLGRVFNSRTGARDAVYRWKRTLERKSHTRQSVNFKSCCRKRYQQQRWNSSCLCGPKSVFRPVDRKEL